jgi:DNA polymerase-3 subunit alpha
MSKYFPLHVHSHFSLLDGLSKPEDIASRCEEIESEGSALTDHGSISGHIQFLQKMKKVGKKPILGCEFYVCNEDATIKNDKNRKLAHLCILAKNDEGWREMVQMVSMANRPDFFYHKPRLDLDRIAQFAQNGNLLAFSGHIGSHMSNILFGDNGDLSSTWRQEGVRLAKWFQNAFGKDNFRLEKQRMDHMNFPKQDIIADCIEQIHKDTGIPVVATPDAHYARQEDAEDQRVLLCSNLRTTIQQASKPEFGMGGFFRSRQYHIPSYEEMRQWHSAEELDNTLALAASVEDYDKILRHPVLPEFKCPEGATPDEYLRHLCREGWRAKVQGGVPQSKHDEYAKRVERELGVLQGAGLSSYFLIVSDIIDFVRKNDWLPGPGRGSAAGCLVSYLIGITAIDPMPYGLIFERFYNAGRNTEDRVSMPDVDMDVPKYAREFVIEYMRKKYGEDKVGQMVTFQTMKGRGALKDVMRAYGGISFDEMNEITKNIMEEHKIADELQKMKEETGDSSIIRWCLENTPKKLEKWCTIDDQGNFNGPLARRFEQAIRLEGTKTNTSKHAAGVVIAPEPLSMMCPMIHDKESGRSIAGFEMDDLELVGGIKFDVLGITALDKAMGVQNDLLTGEVNEIHRLSYQPDFYCGNVS